MPHRINAKGRLNQPYQIISLGPKKACIICPQVILNPFSKHSMVLKLCTVGLMTIAQSLPHNQINNKRSHPHISGITKGRYECRQMAWHFTLSAPQISTTSDSSTTVIRKFFVCISSFNKTPSSLFLQPERDIPGKIHSLSPTHSHKHTQMRAQCADLTDCRLAEFLICYFVGNVGTHENTDGDAQLLLDYDRDQLQAIRALIYPLCDTIWTILPTATQQTTKYTYRKSSSCF